MKLLVILFLLLIPLANASSMTREFNYDGINYTSSDLNLSGSVREITVYLKPSPLTSFDNPGYYVEENIPSGMSFVNTNADWHEIISNKLHVVRLLPNSNSAQLYYKLTLPSETKEFLFDGQYKDDNNLATSISFNRLVFNYAPAFETTSSTSSSDKKFLPNITPIMTPDIEYPPALIDHPITIVPITSEPSTAFSLNIFYLLLLLIPILLYLKFKSDSPKLIKEIAITTTPIIIRIKNPTNKKIYIFVKTKKIPASVIKITALSKFIMPNESLEYRITSTDKVNGSILIYRKDAENV